MSAVYSLETTARVGRPVFGGRSMTWATIQRVRIELLKQEVPGPHRSSEYQIANDFFHLIDLLIIDKKSLKCTELMSKRTDGQRVIRKAY